MNRRTLIELAEECGLLFSEPEDYNHPAQKRLISKLNNLAQKIIRATEEEISDRFEDESIKRKILGGK